MLNESKKLVPGLYKDKFNDSFDFESVCSLRRNNNSALSSGNDGLKEKNDSLLYASVKMSSVGGSKDGQGLRLLKPNLETSLTQFIDSKVS